MSQRPRPISFLTILTVAVIAMVSITAGAQTKRNNRPDQSDTKVEQGIKRNGRPTVEVAPSRPETPPTHFYEFERPGFTYGKVSIRHDDEGRGSITFLKDGFDEAITEPVNLSSVTVQKIADALGALKFLDSTEEYQFARDYSHMGNSTFTLKRGVRSRTVKFNWTENPAAKVLMDEYRRIGNEYTWQFEITVARQNMPLQTPGMMDLIESYLQRNEISDPPHLIPFLTELSTDERLPLMGRNKALKLIKSIEKAKK